MSRPARIKFAMPLPLIRLRRSGPTGHDGGIAANGESRPGGALPRGDRGLTAMGAGPAAHQRGASLVMAIFLITALAALGGLLTQLLVLGSEETINEWYSAQALYAAESGVEWAARDIRAGGSGSISNGVVLTDRAWMTSSVSAVSVGGRTLYTITSIGSAGGLVTAPRAQRRIVVQFMP